MAKDANFRERLRRIRQKRIEQRAGKSLIHSEEEIMDYVSANRVPTMIQHCILKVSKKMPGTPQEKFISAFNICSATFSRYGYTQDGSMTMTGAGLKRNRRHQREKEASTKKSRYTSMADRTWGTAIQQFKKDKADAKKQAKPQKNVAKRRAKLKQLKNRK